MIYQESDEDMSLECHPVFSCEKRGCIPVTYSCQICNHQRRDIAGGALPEMDVESRLLSWLHNCSRGLPPDAMKMAATPISRNLANDGNGACFVDQS